MINLLAKMPFWAIYGISNTIYILLYYMVRYRRRLVLKNIADSFPDKSRKEVKAIAKEFYRNFADYIMETVKLKGVSYDKISGRMTFENKELVEKYLSEGRPIVGYFSHCFNWEWVTILGTTLGHIPGTECSQVYRPLKNKRFDRQLLAIRSRFKAACYPKATVFRELIRRKANGITTLTGFMSDQKPSHGDRIHVVEFLNHPTAVITGTETVARKLKAAAVYFDMTKISRGRYHLRFIPISDDVSLTPDFEATDIYVKLLEANIRRQPSLWLWSHNRWKYPVTMPQDTQA